MTEYINKLAKIHLVLNIERTDHIQKYILKNGITIDNANKQISANDIQIIKESSDIRFHRYSKCPWCNPNVKIELIDTISDSDDSSDWVPDSESDSSGLDTDDDCEDCEDDLQELSEYFDTITNLQDYVKSTKL